MHRRVSASHWLGIRPGLLQSAPTFFVLLPRCSVSFSAKITHDRALDSALFQVIRYHYVCVCTFHCALLSH